MQIKLSTRHNASSQNVGQGSRSNEGHVESRTVRSRRMRDRVQWADPDVHHRQC